MTQTQTVTGPGATPPRRSGWEALRLQARIRARYAVESWGGTRPFLQKELNGHVSPARTFTAPELDPATQLGIKLVWSTAGFFRQTALLKKLFVLGAQPLLSRAHARLYERVLAACEAHGPVAREVELPSYDWRRGTPEDFHARYVKTPHPVILRGFAEVASRSGRWRFATLLERYGDEEVLLTTAKKDGFSGPLRAVDDPRVYLHNCEVLLRRHPELIDGLALGRLEPYIQKKMAYAQLFMGRRGTGSPFHAAAVWNWFVMLEGRKTWYFVDPKDSIFLYPVPAMGRAAAFALCLYPDDYDEEQFPAFAWCPYYQATLEPGDVLLNPPWWWHAVRNQSESSVAVASRWHGDGRVGVGDQMTEEDYQVSPMFSWMFQVGLESFPFLHQILQDPSPPADGGHTLRERNNRYVDLQRALARRAVAGRRFRF
ncbi:MAG: cupin-like domain-containing protein [Myxococcales bacterium]|nr:cupin-like domain-containing protein [Myxococcales bacterium]MCB9755142.1 cupin-like domain-containing protein [Myxococcales bacterium]